MIELFVPGRLCLFGEHSDWAGARRATDETIARGACIISGTDQGIYATACEAPHFEITSRLPDGSVKGPFRIAMERRALREATTAAGFFSYSVGVAAEVRERYAVGGIRVEVERMDLPLGRGLSSSAAICVLTARAFNQIHRLGLSLREEMELAYYGELAAGSQCGRMDQACAYGSQLLLLELDGDAIGIETLAPTRPIHLLVVDLRHSKDTRRILADLHRHFSSAESPHARSLRAALGEVNLDLIGRARSALEGGDAHGVGALMTEAQARFDEAVAPACPEELNAPRLHALLHSPEARELTWGGKGVGSQGDGSAQFVCRGPDERARLSEILERRSLHCLPITIMPKD